MHLGRQPFLMSKTHRVRGGMGQITLVSDRKNDYSKKVVIRWVSRALRRRGRWEKAIQSLSSLSLRSQSNNNPYFYAWTFSDSTRRATHNPINNPLFSIAVIGRIDFLTDWGMGRKHVIVIISDCYPYLIPWGVRNLPALIEELIITSIPYRIPTITLLP